MREALDAGDSQTTLAERLGLSQPTISGWLKEARLDPRASALEPVARKLGINGHWLLTGQGEKRALDGGADAVFAAGFQAGLRRAEEAIKALRMPPAIPEPDEARARGDRGVEAVKKARGRGRKGRAHGDGVA